MEFVKYVRMPKENKGSDIFTVSEQAKLLKKYARKPNVKQREVVIYARANDPLALRRQVTETRAFARKSNLKIAKMIFEKSTSYSKYPEFNRMMNEIGRGNIKTVLIYSTDRLPRIAQLRLEFYGLVQTGKVELVSVTQDKKILKLMSYIDMGMATFERESISRKIRRGIKNSRNKK